MRVPHWDGGPYLHVIHFRNITDDHFTWSTDRSTDGGKTWEENHAVMKNVRVR